MECQGATVAVLRAAHLPPEPELLNGIATAVLNEHITTPISGRSAARPGPANAWCLPTATSRCCERHP